MNPNRNKSTRGRAKSDFYETPYEMARATVKTLYDMGRIDTRDMRYVLDVGCGNGVWTEACINLFDMDIFSKTDFYGIDINIPERNKFLYTELIIADYETYVFDRKFDLIIGNPPFSMMEEFVRKSISLVAEHGTIALMGRLAFLGSQKRANSGGLFREYPPHDVLVSSRRPSFFSAVDNRKTTDMMEYAIYVWRQDVLGLSSLRPFISWFLWDYDK